ncbi:hypothetical protein RMS29_027390 (plasmid) [Agrobacterium rosae]|uniref:YgiT-type zinc finger domain protein n=1 Tax=Agrobacterium rosae TaxID=1972867 RepID=A0AAW9FPQ1_9HYPH|nr:MULTISPECIES: hypothetical protein [Agrobacterium]MCF1501595.1 hypothetical protein [Allorhizobium sp. Av2]MDX8321679.1 hypothetical protein [Agrobacterium sp. rho-8.1]MDX8305141.1 hypothetical protein [Agrobacterium rosae]MDX8311424.1 hypothetical protein [Agrobacterium sp. rho-13.3]MDX8316343.1 hypothetical protein [Agrobacterium rosae]
MKYICQNCSNSFAENELREIRNITERVMPGEIMPAGECPSCGALCHAPLHDAESPVFDALLLAYGSLCARMDPNKRPKTPIDWKTLDAAIAKGSGGKTYTTVMAERWKPPKL